MADHPRERAIPYFDLFDRLGDGDLARLARVDVGIIKELRGLLESIYAPLAEYQDLLVRLSDSQLSKMFGVPESAAHLWRCCKAPESLRGPTNAAVEALNEMLGAPDEDVMIVIEDM